MARDQVERLLVVSVDVARGGDAEGALQILLPNLRDLAEASEGTLLYLAPLSRFTVGGVHQDLLEDYIAAVLEVAAAWRSQDAPIQARVAALKSLPEPLDNRLIARHLLLDVEAASREVAEVFVNDVAKSRATPEGLDLCRALADLEDPYVDDRLRDSLGQAPTAAALAEVDASEAPDDWTRAHTWLVGMPERLREEWGEAEPLLTAEFGRAPSDGRLIGDAQVMSGPNSPIGRDELASMPPLEASRRIASWEPAPDDPFGVSARGLERDLQQIVQGNPRPWAEQAARIVAELHHPTYVAGYFNGLAAATEEIADLAEEIVQAVDLVQQEPWSVETIGRDSFEADDDWANAKDAGIALLRRLWDADADLAAEAETGWQLVAAAVRQRDDESSVSLEDFDALTSAINRPSTRALEAAFAFAAATVRAGEAFPSELLTVLDEELALRGRNGLEARAIIGTRLAFIRDAVPDWYAENRSNLVGDVAPDELGPFTFSMFVKWSRPFEPLLKDEVELYKRALRDNFRDALDHVLLGLLWEISPWSDSGYLLKLVSGREVEAVSEVGEAMARMVREAEDVEVLARASALWSDALDASLPVTAYYGFGWFADVAHLDQGEWLQLMERTVVAADGTVDWAQRVAERAAESPLEPQALHILRRLITGDVKLWDLPEVARQAVRALDESRSLGPAVTVEARRMLREVLVSRGYFEAAEIE